MSVAKVCVCGHMCVDHDELNVCRIRECSCKCFVDSSGSCTGERRPVGVANRDQASNLRERMKATYAAQTGDLLVQYVGNPACGVTVEEARVRIPVRYAYEGDAGVDLYCCFVGSLAIATGHSMVIPCGVAFKVPDGYVGLIKPRSSTFRKHGLQVIEATIDSGYTGAMYVTVCNPGLDGKKSPVVIEPWQRLAQFVIVPVVTPGIQFVAVMPETQRGARGFGSSGK